MDKVHYQYGGEPRWTGMDWGSLVVAVVFLVVVAVVNGG